MDSNFLKILDLIESRDEKNIRLGLLLARNFQEEFENLVDCKLDDVEMKIEFLIENDAWSYQHSSIHYVQNYEEIVVFLLKYNVWEGKNIFEDNFLKLSLSNKEITEIPKSINILKNLCELDLSDNLLKELPEEMGQLTNLYSLDLSNNQLRSLPKSFTRLHNLENLYIKNNMFTALPIEVECLENLKHLSW